MAVMAGLVPAIHVLIDARKKGVVLGTSPGMTAEASKRRPA